MFIIHFAIIGFNTVANNQIVDMQQKIVGGNLVKYFLGDGYGRGFVLNNHFRMKQIVIQNTVCPNRFISNV